MEGAAFRKLILWQRAVALTTVVYRCTEAFPRAELYGPTSQMRRAAVSIPSNIAEGYSRDSRREYARFLSIARGSAIELLTQTVIAGPLGFGDPEQLAAIEARLNELAACSPPRSNARRPTPPACHPLPPKS